MAYVIVTESYLSEIASAIRVATGFRSGISPRQMASMIHNATAYDYTDEFLSGDLYNVPHILISSSTIPEFAFNDFEKLSVVDLPSAQVIMRGAFSRCSSLEVVDLPSAQVIMEGAFYGCTSLEVVSLPSVTNIWNYAFDACRSLRSVYLLGSSVAVLSSIVAFQGTPISKYDVLPDGTYGSIYVPSSLYSAYLSATNWSQYSSRFVAI